MRSGPGAARTILLSHIISARPSKQPLMVRAFLKVCTELGSYFLFQQIKDIIIIIIDLLLFLQKQKLKQIVNIYNNRLSISTTKNPLVTVTTR